MDKQPLIAFSDLTGILKRNAFKIICGSVFVCLCTMLYVLTRPIIYEANATFRDKKKTESGLSQGAKLLLYKENENQSEAVSLFDSRRLLSSVIAHLGLQGTIERTDFKEYSYLTKMANNLVAEKVNWMKEAGAVTLQQKPLLQFQNIHYPGDKPLELAIHFDTDNVFTIVDSQSEKSLGEGKLNQPVRFQNWQFTLVNKELNSLEGRDYSLYIEPMAVTIKDVRKHLHISSEKKDSGLITLSYKAEDRYEAARFLNALMVRYKKHIADDRNHWAKVQVDYLEQRQKEVAQQLHGLMNEHASSVTNDLFATGLFNIRQETDALAKQRLIYKDQLKEINLQLKRLYHIQNDALLGFHNTPHGLPGDGTAEVSLRHLRELKQQRDMLGLALKQSTVQVDAKEVHDSLVGQMHDLEEIQHAMGEIHHLKAALAENDIKPLPTQYMNRDFYQLYNLWQDKLQKMAEVWQGAPLDAQLKEKDQWCEYKANCVAYLNNLDKQYAVYEKILHERLSYHQHPHREFEGVNLATANQLYLEYSHNLDQIQKNRREQQFISDQLNDPQFEINSLSVLPTDPVTQNIIQKSIELALSLRDDNNRSSREQDRVREALAHQKNFLVAHLKQSQDLLNVNEGLVKEKIYSIQNMMVELINQELSVLEKHLEDYFSTQATNLRQEHSLIENQLQELQQTMLILPRKWVSEQILELRLEGNKELVKEVTKLVESKNLNKNLEVVQSAPIDVAVPPLLPSKPFVLLFTALGSGVGLFLFSAFFLVKGFIKGIPASPTNLKLHSQHVSGVLSSAFKNVSMEKLSEADLDTLRGISAFLCSQGHRQSVLAILNGGPSYVPALAQLLHIKERRVLVLPIDFNVATPNDLPGLLQFLEGNAEQCKITSQGAFDTIASGGISRFGMEMLMSAKFNNLMKSFLERYDLIIAWTQTSLDNTSMHNLSKQFQSVLVSVNEESLEQLKPYIEEGVNESGKKRVSFIFYEGEEKA
jgi:tyrosine-protein kinase Etk/Wzc